MYLSREGVEEVNELKARVLDGQGSLSDHQVQRPLGFLQQSIKPNFYIALGCDRTFQLHSLPFT